MLSDFAASAHLAGHRIDVAWVWSRLGTRPEFRLLRRRRAYPAGPADGFPVLEPADLFRAADTPWERVVRVRYVVAGSSAEGALLQAELTFFHAASGTSQPASIRIVLHAADGSVLLAERIDEVSRVVRTLPAAAPWTFAEALEVFHTPGGGAEVPAGVLTVFRDHPDGVTAARLQWAPAVGPALDVDFDEAELTQTRAELRTHTEREFHAVWQRALRRDDWDLATALAAPEPADATAFVEAGVVSLREDFSEDTGDWTRRFVVSDLRAVTEETSYYALFQADAATPGGWIANRDWRAHATATAHYGFPDRIYGLLPAIHQYYDEPEPQDRNRGQLRSFVRIFGLALDHLRSSAESLRTRHDLAEVRGDFLPALGRWIDWPTDRTAALPIQRSDIRMAPAVYESIGTLPNIIALATRVTGWQCEAKEFVHNLFMTNAPEAVPIREVWEMAHDGTDFEPPVRLTTTAHFDGRPAAVVEAGGATRLFWHSNRSGRWELWTRTLDGAGSTDPEPMVPLPVNALPPTFSDLAPAALLRPAATGDELWLVWESDREGAWDIWGRVHDGVLWSAPFRITQHAAPDRRPALALGSAGSLWAFWESERRGPSEIWARTHDGSMWSAAVRVTEGSGRDREPTAALAPDGRLWLVWRRDESDRSRLYARVLDASGWGPESALEDGPWRDESPTLVRRGTDLWLLWSSERTGRWELWGRVHDGAAWGEPFQITLKADPDKEPVVVVDGARLRIFWRSERLAIEYRSRTVDTSDVALLERRGLFADRLHYTYDTARGDLDWYARDVVGLYFTPPPGTPPALVQATLERAATYLEPFCPATVRLVLIPVRSVESLDFFTDGLESDDTLIDAFEDEIV